MSRQSQVVTTLPSFAFSPDALRLTALFPVAWQLRCIDPDEPQDLITGINNLVKISGRVVNDDSRLKRDLSAPGHKGSPSRDKIHDLLFIVVLVLRHHSACVRFVHSHGEIL